MSRDFADRFSLQVGQEEARRRFMNRALNDIFDQYLGINALLSHVDAFEIQNIESAIASSLGERHIHGHVLEHVTRSFLNCLRAIEGLWSTLGRPAQTAASDTVIRLLNDAEVDLGVNWTPGRFVRSGARELDEALVNQPLRWLADATLSSIRQPYEKAIQHFLESTAHPEKLADVITDLYEALEAAAKLTTGKDAKDLSANAELFTKRLGVSPQFGRVLKEYISYANDFRHASAPAQPRDLPAVREVEAFLYLTGVFLRLAQLSLEAQSPRAA